MERKDKRARKVEFFSEEIGKTTPFLQLNKILEKIWSSKIYRKKNG